MSTTTTQGEEIERLLRANRAGDERAGRLLFERCYHELRTIAERQLARERHGHTLAPTALVHETFVRLCGARLTAADRAQFLRVAARVMRNLLIDSARRRRCRVQGEAAALEHGEAKGGDDTILRLETAMQRLGAIDPQLLRVVELRFLVGLDVDTTARQLGRSTATIKRDWRTARAFLQRELDRR